MAVPPSFVAPPLPLSALSPAAAPPHRLSRALSPLLRPIASCCPSSLSTPSSSSSPSPCSPSPPSALLPVPSSPPSAMSPAAAAAAVQSLVPDAARQSDAKSGARARLLRASDSAHVSIAGALLTAGRLVAFPTETVYGLGANAFDASAVASIFSAKRRPSDNPLIVHVSHLADLQIHDLTPLPLSPTALKLADVFWPGPITLILPLSPTSPVAHSVTAGLQSIAIRVPQHPVARAVIAAAKCPIAAPSANRSGRPSPTTAHHVLTDLAQDIDALVDDDHGDSDGSDDASVATHNGQDVVMVGLESTVVDLSEIDKVTGDVCNPSVLRPGAISVADLEKATGLQFINAQSFSSSSSNSKKETTTFLPLKPSSSAVPKAPGMKYRHYAPVASVHLVNDAHALQAAIQSHSTDAKKLRIGILANQIVCQSFNNSSFQFCEIIPVPCGHDQSAAAFGRDLYAALRAFDGEGQHAVHPQVDLIYAVPPEDQHSGIGGAVMNRLSKAAAGRHESVNNDGNT